MPRKKSGRLTASADFDKVYKKGKAISDRLLVLYRFPNESSGRRLGLSVSRKVGGAVVRNRAKRLIREAFEAAIDIAREDCDYVIIARKDMAEASFDEALDSLRGLLERSAGVKA